MARELNSLVEIDFLPVAYRERGMQRRAYAWRVAAAVAIVAFLGATTLWQRTHHAHVLERLADIESQFADAAAKNAHLKAATIGLESERKTAELLTFLRHPWPRTRVLSGILGPLPADIALNELHLGHETIARTDKPAVALPETKTAPTDKASQQAADLERLLREHGEREDYADLQGEAGDAATLHEYLARLGTDPLFDRVDLRSLEHAPPNAAGEPGPVRFSVRIVLRAAHGQAIDSPTTPPAATQSAAPLAQRGGTP
ncbi:MAG: hypothetical protein AB7O59_12920 [Pirellulales bacterium]